MKGVSKGAFAVLAIASLLAIIALTYFWATEHSGACAAFAFVLTVVFVYAVNKCAK